jgi:hypothetical protein
MGIWAYQFCYRHAESAPVDTFPLIVLAGVLSFQFTHSLTTLILYREA